MSYHILSKLWRISSRTDMFMKITSETFKKSDTEQVYWIRILCEGPEHFYLKKLKSSLKKIIMYGQNWESLPWLTKPILLHLWIYYSQNYWGIIKSFISIAQQWASLAISTLISHYISLISPLYFLPTSHLLR